MVSNGNGTEQTRHEKPYLSPGDVETKVKEYFDRIESRATSLGLHFTRETMSQPTYEAGRRLCITMLERDYRLQ